MTGPPAGDSGGRLLLAARLLELRPWELGESARAVPPSVLAAHAGRLDPEARPADLEAGLGALVADGLLEVTDGVCRLSERGREAASRALEVEADRRFEELLLACEASAAYGRLCRRVHGIDLCQLDVLDADQLGRLVASLAPEEGGVSRDRPLRVLDLGCGAGRLAEHLAATTGASVLGIDRSRGAIRRARERVARRPPAAGRVAFRVADLESLGEVGEGIGAAWDAAVAVDSLYFVADLDAAVREVDRLLVPGGRLAVFASELLPEGHGRPWRPEEDAGEVARRTRMALALERHGFAFRVEDFSGAEHALWRRLREAALELREEFEAEGRAELWRLRLAEAERTLEWVEAGRVRRYLYLAAKAPTPERSHARRAAFASG